MTVSDPAGAVLPRGFFEQTIVMNPNRLFVGNLSYKTVENDLQDYFSQAGAVTSVNLMLDRATGKSRGFAFVEFATPEEAAKAVEQFHNKEFHGRQLTVNVARPREERPLRAAERGRAESGGAPPMA
jgi:cold-inducible RNA-binding protein